MARKTLKNEAALKDEFALVATRYRELLDQLIGAGTPGTIDPIAVSCQTGESCCTGTEKGSPLDELMNPDILAKLSKTDAAVVKQVQEMHRIHRELIAKIIDEDIPGVIDPVGLTCNCGDSCGTGSNRADLELEQVAGLSESTANLKR